MKKGYNIYSDNGKAMSSEAYTQCYLDEYNDGKVGRPLKYRPIRRKSTSGRAKRKEDYTDALGKMLKGSKWSALCTATFDRRFKSPYSIYENKILKEEFLKYMPEGWEPGEWEPTKETCYYMMEALVSSLMTYSHKRWKIFYVIEEHKDGTPHIHFMCGNSRWSKDDVYLLSRLWRYMRGGYIKIDEIRADNKKAIDYCLKYVQKDLTYEDWNIYYTEPEQFRIKNFRNTHIMYQQGLKIREQKNHMIKTGVKKRPDLPTFNLDF